MPQVRCAGCLSIFGEDKIWSRFGQIEELNCFLEAKRYMQRASAGFCKCIKAAENLSSMYEHFPHLFNHVTIPFLFKKYQSRIRRSFSMVVVKSHLH